MNAPTRWRVLGCAAALALLAAHRLAKRDSALPGRLYDVAISSVRRLRPPRPVALPSERPRSEDLVEPERPYIRSLKIADVPLPSAAKADDPDAPPPSPASPQASGDRLALPEFGGQAAPSANASAPRLMHISIPRAPRDGGPAAVSADVDSPASAQRIHPPAKAGSGEISAEVASVTAAVRELKTQAAANVATQALPIQRAALMRRLDVDRKVDSGLRSAIGRMQSSGGTASPEALHHALVDVLRANDLNEDDVDEEVALARAESPPPPPIAPEALEQAVDDVLAADPEPPPAAVIGKKAPVPPLRDDPREPIEPLPEPQPPSAPPPRSAMDAYRQNREVLDRALKEFHVCPQAILAILYVETRYGRNTGTNPEIPALNKMGERHPLQSVNDKAALARLDAEGGLGGRQPGQMRGSITGAIGTEQCQPSSCEAYGRSASGAAIDPYSLPDAILFVANYLHRSGYSRDVAASIRAYNHSDEYVRTVQKVSEQIASGTPPCSP